MAITYTEDPANRFIGIVAENEIAKSQVLESITQAKAFIEAHNPVKILHEIRPIQLLDKSIYWDMLDWDWSYLDGISHYALVSDLMVTQMPWFSAAMSMTREYSSCRTQLFAAKDLDKAYEWLSK